MVLVEKETWWLEGPVFAYMQYAGFGTGGTCSTVLLEFERRPCGIDTEHELLRNCLLGTHFIPSLCSIALLEALSP